MYEVSELKRRINENTEAIQRLLESHDRESRWLTRQMTKTVQQSIRTDMILTKNVIEKYEAKRRKMFWEGWKDYMKGVREKKAKVRRMAMLFK